MLYIVHGLQGKIPMPFTIYVFTKNFYIKDYHGRNSDKFMEADFFLPFPQYLELYTS